MQDEEYYSESREDVEGISAWAPDKINGLFLKGSRYLLYLLAVLLPLWFIPVSFGTEFGRELTFGFIIISAAIFWLLSILISGEVRYQHSPLLFGGVLLLAVWGLSALFSKAPIVSLFLSDAVAEKISTILGGLILMVLISSVLTSREDLAKFLFILIFAGGVAGVLTLIQLVFNYPLFGQIVSFANTKDFNAVGTINALALFYTVLISMALGILLSVSKSWKKWIKWALFLSVAVLALDIFLINFRTSWVTLLGASIFLFGFAFKNSRVRKLSFGDEREEVVKGTRRMDWKYFLVVAILAFSIFMIMFRPALFEFNLPAEVSPSFKATWNVSKAVFKEGPKSMILGSGPGTFSLDWVGHKDPVLNQTLFWSVIFNQGFSWFSTIVSTTGILGFAAFFLFIVSAFLIFGKAVIAGTKESVWTDDGAALSTGVFVGLVSIVLTAVLYPGNLTFLLLLFAFIGLLSHLLSVKEENAFFEEETLEDGDVKIAVVVKVKRWFSGFWNMRDRTVRFESQWATFLSSLVIISLLSLGLGALYFQISRLRGGYNAQAALRFLNEGRVDESIEKFERAARFDSKNFNYYNLLGQARIQKVRGLIQRASQGENVQQAFQSEVNRANETLQKGIAIHSRDQFLWRTRGLLYESIVPFIPGSERLAADSYRVAIGLSPLNPTIYVDFGRSGLTFADTLALRSNQIRAEDRPKAAALYNETLQEVRRMLEKAIEVKQDFAPAHFLLSQTSIRMGNIQTAIKDTENAKIAAPFDIGVAFQLGILYYQSGDISRAQAEFERAVAINSSYSNARYFLGLIYDQKGDKERAIAQFEEIEKYNPGNQEVKRILINLRGGKKSLDGIVPPAQPPQERREPPVSQVGQ